MQDILNKKQKLYNLAIGSFIVISFFSNIVLFSVGPFDIKPFYIAMLIATVVSAFKIKIKLPPKPIVFFTLLIVLYSLIVGIKYGVAYFYIIKYICGLITISFFMTLGYENDYYEWCNLFKKSVLIIYIIVFINLLPQINILKAYYFENAFSHPVISCLSGGGVNLESTWLSLYSIVFYKSKYQWIGWFYPFLISLLYSSRVGLIVSIFVLVFFMKSYLKNITSKKIAIVISLFIVVSFFLQYTGLANKIIVRFLSGNKDNGNVGRLRLWLYAIIAIREYPFGVGVGNVMKAMDTVSPLIYAEDNIHNLYMQHIIELGWFIGLSYILLVASFFIKKRKKLLRNIFLFSTFIYSIISFIQFGGGEVASYIMLGTYFATEKNRCDENVDYVL